jgi:cytochrome c553
MRACVFMALLLVAASAGAVTKTLTLPADGVQLKASTLPGYTKAQAQCVACHSAEYMLYQPATAPRAYWENMVRRMQQVFKAPVNDGDIPELVDYLVKTYGNEQGK